MTHHYLYRLRLIFILFFFLADCYQIYRVCNAYFFRSKIQHANIYIAPSEAGLVRNTNNSISPSLDRLLGVAIDENLRKIKVAALNIHLKGILFERNHKKSIVIIEQNGVQNSYYVGDIIAGTSYPVKEIHQDGLMIEVEQSSEFISFNEK